MPLTYLIEGVREEQHHKAQRGERERGRDLAKYNMPSTAPVGTFLEKFRLSCGPIYEIEVMRQNKVGKAGGLFTKDTNLKRHLHRYKRRNWSAHESKESVYDF